MLFIACPIHIPPSPSSSDKAAWYISDAPGSDLPSSTLQFESGDINKVIAHIKQHKARVGAGYKAIIVVSGTLKAKTPINKSMISINSPGNNDFPPIVLRGDEKTGGVLDAEGKMRILYISGADVTLAEGLVLKNGNSAIVNDSFGGGVLVWGGSFTMTGGSIENCYAVNGGGIATSKISNVGGSGTIPRNYNKVSMSGGTISACTIQDNCNGAGIYIASDIGEPDDELYISGSALITENKVGGNTGSGGGVYLSGKLIMTGGEITANEASQAGGGLYIVAWTGKAELNAPAKITGNTANQDANVYVGTNASFINNGAVIN